MDLFILAVGAVAVLLILGMGMVLWNQINPPAARRLKKTVQGERQIEFGTQSQLEVTRQLLKKRISPLARFSMQEDKKPEEASALTKQLQSAGYRNESAKVVYFSFKTLLTLVLPLVFLLGVLILQPAWKPALIAYIIFFMAAGGYFLPNIVLRKMVARRREELSQNFPDALDLLRTCVEAGLSVDAGLARVGEEMRIRSRALADELRQVVLEQRAGASRNQALANMAERVGIRDVEAMVASLIQSEKFGTSIAESLRVYSESLRLDRRLKAEEQAAKIPTKILLPLIACIFPLLFILILAPPIHNVLSSFHHQ
ncbi:type II secretion system F family protein [Ferrovum sp.]|jgi:Flp pilus assembly protein TadC|uniref:type II secretion system F family protein n=1 Tax=Ferrovum sp. TaxID=2609467 RepID=UPI002622A69A|nr:type II secretion system F family protein [Ferrovum sp.]